jgi:hypothetical protein
MKRLAFVLCAALLPGCAADQMKPFLDNLSHDCTRHYTGSVGGTLGTATVAFDISCAPEGTTTTTTVTVPAAKPNP